MSRSVLSLVAVLAVAVSALSILSVGEPAQAATLLVTKTEDTNDGACDADCSLREAVIAANAEEDADTITVPAGIYVLTLTGAGEGQAQTGDLDVREDLTLIGSGADATVIDGNDSDRIFDVSSGTLSLIGVTVRNGNTVEEAGGGISNRSDLIVAYSRLTDNAAETDGGGAIFTAFGSTTTIRSTTIDSNSAGSGGGLGVQNGGHVTVTDSTISDNAATAAGGEGGGIDNVETVDLTNVTLSGNSAVRGGAIQTRGIFGGGTTTLTNVTLSGNTATDQGGGIWTEPDGTTILTNSIVAASPIGGGCSGPIVSQGHNLDTDGSCGLAETGDLSAADPKLGALADNGGPTMTHALTAGSDAIDAGDDGVCPDHDQRHYERPVGVACDMGAFESAADPMTYLWGDIDCSGEVNPGDSLKLLLFSAGDEITQEDGCPAAGDLALVDGTLRFWPDTNCSGGVDLIDMLNGLRHEAGLDIEAVGLSPGACPEIATEVVVG